MRALPANFSLTRPSGGSSASMGSMGKKPALSKKEQKKQEELQKQKEKAMHPFNHRAPPSSPNL